LVPASVTSTHLEQPTEQSEATRTTTILTAKKQEKPRKSNYRRQTRAMFQGSVAWLIQEQRV